MWTQGLVPTLAGCAVLLACGALGRPADDPPPPEPPVTDADAREALADAVAAVESGDLDGLCARSANSLMCESTLEELGPASVPVGSAPVVVGSRAVPSRRLPGGGGTVGGRLLETCGVDGQGRPYATELMVIQDRRGPALMNPVYWSGIGYLEPEQLEAGPPGGVSASAGVTAPAPEAHSDWPPAPPCPAPP